MCNAAISGHCLIRYIAKYLCEMFSILFIHLSPRLYISTLYSKFKHLPHNPIYDSIILYKNILTFQLYKLKDSFPNFFLIIYITLSFPKEPNVTFLNTMIK